MAFLSPTIVLGKFIWMSPQLSLGLNLKSQFGPRNRSGMACVALLQWKFNQERNDAEYPTLLKHHAMEWRAVGGQ